MSDRNQELREYMREMFCREYVSSNGHGTESAIKAGYSVRSAHVQASRMLKDIKIQNRIRQLRQERINAMKFDADAVLIELARIAKVDVGQAFNPDGTLKPIHDIPEDVRRAMSSVEIDEIYEGFGVERRAVGQTKKVKFIDKNRALENIGRNLKLFTDKVEHSVDEDLANRLSRARNRIGKT